MRTQKAASLACFGLLALLLSIHDALGETYADFARRLSAFGQFDAQTEVLLLGKVNAYRARLGLGPLAPDPSLQFAARAQAEDMGQHDRLGHWSSTGLDFQPRMEALLGGRLAFDPISENAVYILPPGPPERMAERMFQSWLGSWPHRKNMENPRFLRAATGVIVVGTKAWGDMIFTGPPAPKVQTNSNWPMQ
jgi:uncharacterized protein YkwD